MTAAPVPEDQPRPWWQIVFFGSILGIVIALALYEYGIILLVHPIELWVEGDAPGSNISVGTLSPDGIELAKIKKCFETPKLATFASDRFPYTGIVLFGKPAALDGVKRVTTRMAMRRTIYDRSQFESEWIRWDGPIPSNFPEGTEARVLRGAKDRAPTVIAILQDVMNYDGDAALAKYVLTNPLFVTYGVCFLALLFCRAMVGYRQPIGLVFIHDAGDDSPPALSGGRSSWPWMIAGVGVLITAGFILEMERPYYFSQDDNFAQFLPNILYGCDTLFAGAIPSWNPHQYLGAPLAEIGTYALTYPGTYLSYVIAVYGLDNRNATLEVFCLAHLLLGYFATFWLGRKLGMPGPLAAAFSLCQVLSGFALIAGRSWYYMTPVFLWVPLIFVAIVHLQTKAPTLRWTIGAGLAIGLFFHAGNAQMWVYAMSLAGIFAIWSCANRTMPWSRLVHLLPAGCIGLGVAAILLVPQFLATRELKRKGGLGSDIGEGVLAMIAPYPTPVVPYWEDQRKYADPEHFGTLYYAGSVLTIAWVCALLGVCLRRGGLRSFVREPWNGLALLTFVLGLGHVARLWTWQSYLPVFDQFTHPFKFLPFVHLFSCAGGALWLNRAIVRSPQSNRWYAGTFLLVAALLLYNAFWARSSLFVYAEQPYPPLQSEWKDLQAEAPNPVRILPLTLMRSQSADYVAGLQHHFPTVYGISSIGGYDPIIEQDIRYRTVLKELKADPRRTLRKHGVTHLVLHREVTEAWKKREWASDKWGWLPISFSELIADCESEAPVMQNDHVRVFAVKDTTPLAYPVLKTARSLPIRYVPAGIDVDVAGRVQGQEVALSFLWRPGTRVYADGALVASVADRDQHIRVTVPMGTSMLSVRYESPWTSGLMLGGACVTVGLLGWIAVRRWSAKATLAKTETSDGMSRCL